jgi:hypothetical protein
MASTEVTKPATGASVVPALAPTPSLDVDKNDVALPKLKLGQPQNATVVDGLVPAYSIFSTLGADDAEPQVLYEHGKGDGVLIHVLSLRKRKSIVLDKNGQPTKEDGELFIWGFHDSEAHPLAKTNYTFDLCLPEVDADVPYTLFLKATATPAARNIITVLLKNQERGPSYANAFRLTTKENKQDTYRWATPIVRQVEADEANVQASSVLSELVNANPPQDLPANPTPTAADEPAI